MDKNQEKDFSALNYIGLAGFILVVFILGYGLYCSYCDVCKQNESYKVMSPQTNGIEPSPVVTESPFSNAPVKGEAKEVVVPEKIGSGSIDKTSTYTMSSEPVIRWDLIPPSAKMVTIGFAMTNPPIPEKEEGFNDTILTSVPVSSGIAVSFDNRSKYKIDVGTGNTFSYVRDNSYWKPDIETVEICITQTGPSSSRIEVKYNGDDSVLTSSGHVPVSIIKSWSQRTKIFDTNKVRNVWVRYGV